MFLKRFPRCTLLSEIEKTPNLKENCVRNIQFLHKPLEATIHHYCLVMFVVRTHIHKHMCENLNQYQWKSIIRRCEINHLAWVYSKFTDHPLQYTVTSKMPIHENAKSNIVHNVDSALGDKFKHNL